MVIIETGADDTNFGEMVCHWDENPALMMIRRDAEALLRAILEPLKSRAGSEWPAETEIQGELDALMTEADSLFEECAHAIFFEAQKRLVLDVKLKMLHRVTQRITVISAPDGKEPTPVLLAEILDEEMQPLKDLRKRLAEFSKTRHNQIIGIKRGREAGKKDTKPREKRADSADQREKILTAIRAIGREFYKKDLALEIGISEPTLRGWLKKIKEDFGEDLDDLTGVGLSTES